MYGVERGWPLLVATAWWACSAGEMWRDRSCGDIYSSKLKEDKKTLDVIQRTALQMHHSPPCRDPPWHDGTSAVMASLAPPQAASKEGIWGKCGSSWAAFQPWESPALWLPCSIKCIFFLNTDFAVFLCKWDYSTVLMASADQFFNRYNTREKASWFQVLFKGS